MKVIFCSTAALLWLKQSLSGKKEISLCSSVSVCAHVFIYTKIGMSDNFDLVRNAKSTPFIKKKKELKRFLLVAEVNTRGLDSRCRNRFNNYVKGRSSKG